MDLDVGISTKVLPIVPLMALMVIFSGCVSRPAAPPGSVASIEEAVLCYSFDFSKGPSQIGNTYKPDAHWIICSVKVSTAPSGTMLKTIWQYPDGSTREQVRETEGSGYYSFTIMPKAYKVGKYLHRYDDFPIGDYKVKIFLNDVEKTLLEFKVQK